MSEELNLSEYHRGKMVEKLNNNPCYKQGRQTVHPNAKETVDFGDSRLMKCPDCGQEWEEELPQ